MRIAAQNQKELDSQSLYIICEGKVRLLSFGLSGDQQPCIQLLKDGETFGGDFYFCQASLPYQAIAASIDLSSPESRLGSCYGNLTYPSQCFGSDHPIPDS